ncbi:MAG: OmpA family protein [Pseudomonadota bacterium]
MRYFWSTVLAWSMGILCQSAFAQVTLEQSTEDLLDLANGALVLEATSEYNESTWGALTLIDGTTKTGWATKSGATTANEIVIELASLAQLSSFVIDTNGIDGVGRGAKRFKLFGSAVSSKDGFIELVSGEALEGVRTEFPVIADEPVRWLRLEVADNWGAPKYTEIMELEAYGVRIGTEQLSNLSGVYATNYNLMRIEQSGRAVEGCYDYDNGTLSGDTDGRVIRFEWREDGPQIGTAVMVLTADASYLNGLWYEDGILKGVWRGPLVTDGREPVCQTGQSNLVSDAIKQSGTATLYGIRFDLDSATLRSDSTQTLEALREALISEPDWRIMIEGHTDSQGADAYNLELSASRAASVKSWLMEQGIDAGRLETVGKGENEPEADNDTPQGRALNRRVVIRKIE